MKNNYWCPPCILRQTLDLVRSSTEDEVSAEVAVKNVFRAMSEMDFSRDTAAIKRDMNHLAKQSSGNGESYERFKTRLYRYALEAFPKLVTHVETAGDPLEAALKVAASIDIFAIGTNHHCDLQLLKTKLADTDRRRLMGDPEEFYRQATAARSILYLLDGAGQVFSDRLLITQLPREKITVAVGADEIGSATLEEARIAGLDRMVEVIERGADIPGAPVDECGQSFRRRFDQADLVIAKGQGNYETLGEVDKKIYFLMTADCPIIAAEIGCQPGELALYSRN